MNKPLTIEQLKALEVGDWVWIESETYGKTYAVIEDSIQDGVLLSAVSLFGWLNYADYGKTWLAYKNKEQAECKGEIVELPEPFIDTDINGFGEKTYLVYRSKVDIYCPSDDIYLDETKAELRLAELKGELK